MTDFISKLGEAIVAESTGKSKVINKEDFKENLHLLITRYATFIAQVGSMSETERTKLADRIVSAADDREVQFCKIYTTIAKRVGSKDLKLAFESYLLSANNFKKMLDALHKNIDNIFEQKTITIHNSKLSLVATLGLLRHATIFCDFAIFLFNGIGYEIARHNGINELDQPKRYRFNFINKHQDTVREILEQMLSGQGAYLLANGVVALQKSKNDILLVDKQSNPNLAFVTPHLFSKQIHGLLQTGVRGFGAFRWLGEQWNMIRHAKYRKMQMEKAQIESHVALLQLDLMDIDPNSTEYQRHVKIINSYNEMVAHLDQKIDDYEKE